MPLLNWTTCGALSNINRVSRIISTPNGYIYIVGDDNVTPYGYVNKSIDSGTSWTSQSLVSIAYRAYDITYKTNDTLFVCYRGTSPIGCSAGKTINQGTNWTDLPNAAGTTPNSIFYDIDNSTLYMGEQNSTSHIFKSINDGASWITDHTFSTTNANANQFVKYGSYIYCSTNVGKIFRTVSGSGTWTQLASLPNVSNTYTIYVDGDVILAGGENTSNYSTIWKSVNAGASWTEVHIGSAAGNKVNEIIKVGNYYAAVIQSVSVYISLDAESWIDMNLIGSGSDINSICISDTDLYVNRASTIYKADASELFIPIIPSNIICDPGIFKNTLTFSEPADATSYNLYWTKAKVKNEYFVGDSRWSSSNNGVGETAIVSGGQLTLDVPDGVDGLIRTDSLFNIDNGNTEIVIDLISYNPDDSSNGVTFQFRFLDASAYADYVTLTYWQTSGGNTHNVTALYKENSSNHSTTTTVPTQPTKLKIQRINNYLTISLFYSGSWNDIAGWDYASRGDNLTRINIQLLDKSLHGGSCVLDNLVIEPSVKDFQGDSLTETFENLDDWTVGNNGFGSTATIIGGQCVLDVPDSTNGWVYLYHNDDLPDGSYEYEIDVTSYVPDNTTNGVRLSARLTDVPDATFASVVDGIIITIGQIGISNFSIIMISEVDNVQIVGTTYYTTSIPSKLKFIRSNNVFYSYYYDSGVYNLAGYRDFSSRASNVITNYLLALRTSNRGGSIALDNLIITSPGTCTKITGITSSPYDHITGDTDEYIYNLTAINSYGESLESDEVFGAPVVYDPPTNVGVTPGIIKNDITWDAADEADSYNLYWMLYEYYDELFGGDLSDWDQYKDNGSETIEIDTGELVLDTTSLSTPGAHLIRKTDLPAGDFSLSVDLTDYVAETSNFGPFATFAIYDTYSPGDDWVKIYYWETSDPHRVITKFNLNGSITTTSTAPASRPTKFKITRVGNILTTYYYNGSSWVLHATLDFSSRSSNLFVAALENIIDPTEDPGLTTWDNLVYYKDLKTEGTKITGVTSPYSHTPLTAGINYIYALTSDGYAESVQSEIESGAPLPGTPDPPTSISIISGEELNTVTFTEDGEADQTNLYWLNSPGVSKLTGNEISDISSPYAHIDLDPDLTYYYVLVSENVYGEGDESSEYNSSPYPAFPENVVATPGIEKITLTWDAALGADTYNVYWSESPNVSKITGTKITGVTSPYDHTSRVPGQTYYYVICSEDEDGESSVSAEVNGIPNIAAPLNSLAELSDALEITVSWDSVVGATIYNIYWAKTPGVTKLNGTKIAGASSPYAHTGLDDEDTYYYVITAENAVEEGSESAEVNAVVGDVPIAPSNVVASGTDIQEITLTWDAVVDADSYNLYYRTLAGVTKIVGTKIMGVTSPYVFNASLADIYYYFVVTSVDDVTGESTESSEVNALSIPPIPNPPLISSLVPGSAEITLNWSSAPYADSYNIYWDTSSGVTQLTGTPIVGANSGYSFSVPDLYQTYYFVVTAINESGESTESLEVYGASIAIIPDVPENVIGSASASNEITIEWDEVTYATSYTLYYERLPNVSKSTASKIEGITDLFKVMLGLISDRTYYFAVSSVNAEGESDLSDEVSVKVIVSLTGQSILYIKTTSKYNYVEVEWSDLAHADSYNIYWSKTTPVSTSTATKIEGASSPYRHYITPADDPYYVVVGENPLGESDLSEESFSAPMEVTFQSINFLPENLREYPLFMEFCSILDYVVQKYHYDNVDKLSGLYDVTHASFDPDYILGLIGSEYFLSFDLTTDQKKALCLMLSNLYDMKGTRKGLDYILRLLNLEAQVYEWYDVNAGVYPDITDVLDPCDIILDLGIGDFPLLEDAEESFITLANYLLWVCVGLYGIFWSKSFENWFEGIEDDLATIDLDEYVNDKFCSWTYNYPDMVIIGSPVEGNVAYIGESGLNIGDIVFDGNPLFISPDALIGADYDGVCEAHYIGESGIYIGDVSDGLSSLTYIIEED